MEMALFEHAYTGRWTSGCYLSMNRWGYRGKSGLAAGYNNGRSWSGNSVFCIKCTVDKPLLRRYLPAYAVNVFALAIRIILDFNS